MSDNNTARPAAIEKVSAAPGGEAWPKGAVFTDMEGGFYDENAEPLREGGEGDALLPAPLTDERIIKLASKYQSLAYADPLALVRFARDCAALSPSGAREADAPTDTERLDFLDATNQRFRMGWKVGTAPAGNVSVQSVIQLGAGPLPSIREAIDAAKEAAK